MKVRAIRKRFFTGLIPPVFNSAASRFMRDAVRSGSFQDESARGNASSQSLEPELKNGQREWPRAVSEDRHSAPLARSI
ncbi:MAG: hypothetical protein AUG51_18055 [Acidobacteria bacterium 13_1_20CM_3_53_8]|nr:MAG: hypothetical protein AUG51_18055 [Acidobacteria bacterium 13_1_20CM_3_53_8]